MGFRSTFTTEDYAITWPDWFVDKYQNYIWFNESKSGALHPKFEAKCGFGELEQDIQKCLTDENDSLVLVYLHECGGITRCQIERDLIIWSEPDSWALTPGITHSYCYGCSDAKRSSEG